MVKKIYFEAVQEERNMFFNLSVDMICVFTFDGKFHSINPAFTNTIGYSESEILNHSMLYFVHLDDVKKTLAAMELLSKKSGQIQFENRYHCKDGTYKWLSWTANANTDTIYASARDITDLKLKYQLIDELTISKLVF